MTMIKVNSYSIIAWVGIMCFQTYHARAYIHPSRISVRSAAYSLRTSYNQPYSFCMISSSQQRVRVPNLFAKSSNEEETVSSDKPSQSSTFFNRREVLSNSFHTVSAATLLSLPELAAAEPTVNPMNVDNALIQETGLLESRVTENLMSAPTYGLEKPDVYYPP